MLAPRTLGTSEDSVDSTIALGTSEGANQHFVALRLREDLVIFADGALGMSGDAVRSA